MGNLLNRLFGSESRETGCKRPFSKHNKVNLHGSSSKKSSSNAASASAVSPTTSQPVISEEQPQPVHEEHHSSAHPPSDQPSSSHPETSPFQRDFITSHQPLVSLEKSRPRRSNIRRSSRMNASMGKGDSATTAGAGRPVHGHHHHQQQLSSVSSIVADEDAIVVRATNASTSHQPSGTVISNRADPSLPVVTHNNQSAQPSQPTWLEQQQEILEEGESLEPAVDELSPNERHKVAKSRISQMFIKREKTNKHISMIAPLELSRGLPEEKTSLSANSSPTHLTANGFFVNTDYERVYDSHGHYKARQEGEHSQNEIAAAGDDEADFARLRSFAGQPPLPNAVDEGRNNSEHDQRKRVSSVDDDDEQAVSADAGSTEGALAPSARPEVTPRRKHMMQGNPLLIDELKKRQSTFYQTTVE
ncbi:hypothetical protein TYRP_000120 [Tyrophagus putrescentiae]|nr:hypothetical protein TYRP_000120 [Tyrophagus putrescentiae]